jgi:hypothetical protein
MTWYLRMFDMARFEKECSRVKGSEMIRHNT